MTPEPTFAEFRSTIARMEFVLSNVPSGLAWFGPEGRVKWCNSAFAALLNRERLFVLGRTIEPLLPLWKHGARLAGPSHPIVAALREKRGFDDIFALRDTDDAPCYRFSGRFSTFLDGEEYLSVTAIDISDSLRLERAVAAEAQARQDNTELERQLSANRALAERLRESEARFRAMVDSIPQLAWMAEPDGFIFWYNVRWYEYTGTTEEQMRGWGWQIVHDPDILPKVLDRWRASIATGEPFEMEFPLKGADGRFRWFLTRVFPLKDPATGAVTRWFGTNTDVNESVALVERRTAELRSMVAEYETFAYSVAHDLRAPIRTITGFGGMLLRRFGEALPEEAKRLLSEILTAGGRMDQLVLDLLAYSRLSRETIELKPTDSNVAVRRVLESLDADIRKTGAKVDVRPRLPAVMAQDSLLDQILANLISNALKFVKPGTIPVVVVRAETHDGRVRVWVEDNGIGIAQEFHDKVFRVFERLHGPAEYSGTGIGLAIVRRAAERMGGAVGLVSEPGRGSRFWLELAAAGIST